MTTDTSAWSAYLDSLESELQAAQHNPGRWTQHAAEFVPPSGLGPLPRQLAARARTLLRSVDAATADLRTDLERTRQQLDELRQMDPRGPKPPGSFDARA